MEVAELDEVFDALRDLSDAARAERGTAAAREEGVRLLAVQMATVVDGARAMTACRSLTGLRRVIMDEAARVTGSEAHHGMLPST